MEKHVALTEIPPQGKLDRIHAFWLNEGPGVGYVTIICWGNAWTAYFGAMGDYTIQEFFGMADVGYMTSKMQGQFTRESKKHDAYLGEVITSVKQSLANSTAEAPNDPQARGDPRGAGADGVRESRGSIET